jgi:hypothetical protein
MDNAESGTTARLVLAREGAGVMAGAAVSETSFEIIVLGCSQPSTPVVSATFSSTMDASLYIAFLAVLFDCFCTISGRSRIFYV